MPRGFSRNGGIMKRRILPIIFAVLTFLAAVCIMLYPAVSSYVNDKYRSEIHTVYEEQLEQADNTELHRVKELAVAYNEAITPGASSSDAYSQAALLAASTDYDSLLNITGSGIMGYVDVPKINVYLPIYHNTDTKTLERGVGHLLGSSLPVGGESTHTILTGHSGMATQKLFTDLSVLEIGDVFYLHILDEVLAYQVDEINTVLPYDTTHLGITQGEDHCTLVTCTPIGVNTHRLLVRGTRIPYEEAQETEQENREPATDMASDWEDQYLLGILLGILGALIIAFIVVLTILIRRLRRRKKRRKGGRYLRKAPPKLS